jgi:hypothetical protein
VTDEVYEATSASFVTAFGLGRVTRDTACQDVHAVTYRGD